MAPAAAKGEGPRRKVMKVCGIAGNVCQQIKAQRTVGSGSRPLPTAGREMLGAPHCACRQSARESSMAMPGSTATLHAALVPAVA
jgi:hypothetical protein